MTEIFCGKWLLRITFTRKGVAHRLTISNSDSSDGGRWVKSGDTLEVSGLEWSLTIQWAADDRDVPLQPCIGERINSFTPDEGLVASIVCNDLYPNRHIVRGIDLSCSYLDLPPMPPPGPPIVFTRPGPD